MKIIRILFITILTSSASPSFASILKKIMKEKGQAQFEIESEQSLSLGSKVCFFQKNKRVGCGDIISIDKKTATVQIKSKKTLSRLKPGLEVRIGENGSISDLVSTKDIKNNKGRTYLVGVFSAVSVASPISFSNISYETPQGSSGVSSLWKKSTGSNTIGGGLELGIEFPSAVITLGINRSQYIRKRILTDFRDTNPGEGPQDIYFEEFVESEISGDLAGSFLDISYLNYNIGIVTFRFGNGLGYIVSKLNLNSNLKNQPLKNDPNIETIGEFYTAFSEAYASLLRTHIAIDLLFNSFGLQLKSSVTSPIKTGQYFELITNNDSPEFTSLLQNTSVEDDLKKSLDHKAKLGVELTLSVYSRF